MSAEVFGCEALAQFKKACHEFHKRARTFETLSADYDTSVVEGSVKGQIQREELSHAKSAMLHAKDGISWVVAYWTNKGAKTGGDPPASKRDRRTKGRDIDGQILKMIIEDRTRIWWSAREFGKRLSCRHSTVTGCKTWTRFILPAREMERSATRVARQKEEADEAEKPARRRVKRGRQDH
jgi:hypothetical protein